MTEKLRIEIPEDLDFAELNLGRDTQTGDIMFDWAPFERLCAHNGIDIAIFRERHEDNVGRLFIAWYDAHLKRGGAPDLVFEDIISEMRLEDECGGGISHPPGRG